MNKKQAKVWIVLNNKHPNLLARSILDSKKRFETMSLGVFVPGKFLSEYNIH
jgi:hypothetical protein